MRVQARRDTLEHELKLKRVRLSQGMSGHDPAWVHQEMAFLAKLRGLIAELEVELVEAHRAVATARQALSLAQREEEVILALRDENRHAWRMANLREEQRILDDLRPPNDPFESEGRDRPKHP